MSLELIAVGIFVGTWLGIGFAFLLMKIKNNSHKRKLLKEIREKRLKFTLNGKPLDSIEKEKVGEKKPKVRVKKKKVKKKKIKKKLKKRGSKKK